MVLAILWRSELLVSVADTICRNNIQNSRKSRNKRKGPLDHYGDLCELQQHLLDLVQDLVVGGISRRMDSSCF